MMLRRVVEMFSLVGWEGVGGKFQEAACARISDKVYDSTCRCPRSSRIGVQRASVPMMQDIRNLLELAEQRK